MIDLRSDTVTQPTETMRKAMYEAKVGDVYYGDDPTVAELENLTADLVGKQAAIFMPSGTMSNLVAMLLHTRRGDSVIMDAMAHTLRSEAAHMSAIAGALPSRIASPGGILDPEAIRDAVVEDGVLRSPTTLVWVENTNNAAGGICTDAQHMASIGAVAREYGMAIHVDGARIFNASVYLGVETMELVRDADTVSFCLTKGLSCPFGSMLCGTKEHIDKARKFRIRLGGGMRQAGIMAAAGIVALQHMIGRLEEDHENAALLWAGLAELGFDVKPERMETNILFAAPPENGITNDEYVKEMMERGIVIAPRKGPYLRLVTHYGITRDDIRQTLSETAKVLG